MAGVGRARSGTRVRLKDVAESAGVHVATASRALSPDPAVAATVSTARREAVLAAASRLGYRPNRAGRALRTGDSRLLGLLVPRVSDTALSVFYEGMLQEAEQEGYTVVVASTRDDPERRRDQIDQFVEHGVDGILYTDAHLGESFDTTNLPVPVLPAYRYPHTPSGITADDEVGGALVARHLLALGHSSYLVLAGMDWASTTVDRTGGFTRELELRGTGREQVTVLNGALGAREGREAATGLLTAGVRPTAVFAVDDYLALGVLSAIHQAGLVPGVDVALVGYSDLPLAAELQVPLSSVHVPLADLGARALQSLLQVVRGEEPADLRVEPSLTVRASSAGPTTGTVEASAG